MIEVKISKTDEEDFSEVSRKCNMNEGVSSTASEVIDLVFEAMVGLGYQAISVAEAMEEKAQEYIPYPQGKEE